MNRCWSHQHLRPFRLCSEHNPPNQNIFAPGYSPDKLAKNNNVESLKTIYLELVLEQIFLIGHFSIEAQQALLIGTQLLDHGQSPHDVQHVLVASENAR